MFPITPTKSIKCCCVCGEIKQEIRYIESKKGKEHNLIHLLEKYGGISLVEGIICRNCHNKLLNLDKTALKFRNQCQSTKSKSKRCSREPLEDITFTLTDTSCINYLNNDSGIFSPVQSSTCDSSLFSPPQLSFYPVYSTPLATTSKTPQMKFKKTLHFTSCEVDAPSPIRACAETMEMEKKNPLKEMKRILTKERTDHDYIKKKGNEKKEKKKRLSVKGNKVSVKKNEKAKHPTEDSLKAILTDVFTNTTECHPCLTKNDSTMIMQATQLGSVKILAETIMTCEKLNTEIQNCILRQSSDKIKTLFNKKHGFVSNLMTKKFDDLKHFSWKEVVNEGIEQFPLLMKLLLCLMVPSSSPNLESKVSNVIPRLGMVYGIIAQGRYHELSKVQRVMSMNLADNIADQKIYDRLQPTGVCLSYQGTLNVMEEIGNHFSLQLKEAVNENKRIRIVGDNVNFSVGQADLRMKSEGKLKTLHHAFSSAALIHKFQFPDLSDTEPEKDSYELQVNDLIPNHEDYLKMKEAFTFHVTQLAVKFLPFFKFLKGMIKHPECLHQDELSSKTQVVLLDTLYKNEQKYDDVVDILDSYENVIAETFKDMNPPTIHIGGDQLTRERFSGAKALRAGAADPKEQLEHLHPITFEMFHLQMNFLMVFFKFLYSDKSSNEIGTMKCEINRIMRTNVDSDVRKAYDADKDFVVSFVDSYIIEMVCHYFGMETNLSTPTRNIDGVHLMTDALKAEWATKTFGEIVSQYVWNSEIPTPDENVIVEGQFLPICLKLANGKEIKVSAKIEDKKDVRKDSDYVKNYAHMVVDLGLMYKELLYICKQPDRNMILSLMKRCMVIFKAKSNNSKYAFEVHRFLVQQHSLLSQKAATETLYSMFVNTHGRKDTHIPADLQMEYLVKLVKKHIKHMFSNKTEDNISKRTKSISGVEAISENYDRATDVVKRSMVHKNKDADMDELTMVEDLRKLKPFEYTAGRKHNSFPDIKPSVDKYLNVNHFHRWVKDTIMKHVYTP